MAYFNQIILSLDFYELISVVEIITGFIMKFTAKYFFSRFEIHSTIIQTVLTLEANAAPSAINSVI